MTILSYNAVLSSNSYMVLSELHLCYNDNVCRRQENKFIIFFSIFICLCYAISSNNDWYLLLTKKDGKMFTHAWYILLVFLSRDTSFLELLVCSCILINLKTSKKVSVVEYCIRYLLQTVHAISSLLSPHPSRPEHATAVLLQRPFPHRSGQKSAALHLSKHDSYRDKRLTNIYA